jgi:hypothetical protein
MDGIKYFIVPEWSKLLEVAVKYTTWKTNVENTMKPA